jgi:S-adenosyl-L-methionine hydrolase (adenosine-forming)
VRVVTFLSDYGLSDEFVGVCHGVIVRRCPDAHVIDIGHEVPRHDIQAGALMLAAAVPFMPPAVHLAIVDPGVGAVGPCQRRAIAVAATSPGHLLVGPDNGLLAPAIAALGGAAHAIDIGSSSERLQPTSATFHGRDLFAPVAGALAAGAPLAELGEALDTGTLLQLQLTSAELAGEELRARVLALDRFGNIATDASEHQLAALAPRSGAPLIVSTGGLDHRARLGATFADVPAGELVVLIDARRAVTLAVNHGSAAASLGLAVGDPVTVRSP